MMARVDVVPWSSAQMSGAPLGAAMEREAKGASD
jgi:hypothetical protein